LPSYAPAISSWAGQEQKLALARPAYAEAFITGQTQIAGPNYAGTNLTKPRLDRLGFDEGISNNIGRVNINFQRKYQDNVTQTEDAISGIIDSVTAIQLAFDEVAKANARAQTAIDSADAANKEAALQGSNTDPISVLSATDAGIVTIIDHSRFYGADRSVSVTGTVLAETYAPGTIVRPYYDDLEQVGGEVSWQAVTGEAIVSQTNGRHLAGGVRIPEADEPPSEGAPVYPPG